MAFCQTIVKRIPWLIKLFQEMTFLVEYLRKCSAIGITHHGLVKNSSGEKSVFITINIMKEPGPLHAHLPE
jgi:hypothetical protein